MAIAFVFAYLSFYSNLYFGSGENKFLTTPGVSNHSASDNDSGLSLDTNASSILVALWIGLMIIGSFLLFHIHFKVLPKE